MELPFVVPVSTVSGSRKNDDDESSMRFASCNPNFMDGSVNVICTTLLLLLLLLLWSCGTTRSEASAVVVWVRVVVMNGRMTL